MARDRSSNINPRERAIRYAAELGALKKFLLDQPSTGEFDAVKWAEFIVLAGSQLRNPGARANIIIIGSPLHADSNQPAFSLAAGVPSDGCITADPSESIYATKHRRSSLAGVAVHWAYLQPPWLNEYHTEGIQRFLSLYIGSMGGTLATFASDPASRLSGRWRASPSPACARSSTRMTRQWKFGASSTSVCPEPSIRWPGLMRSRRRNRYRKRSSNQHESRRPPASRLMRASPQLKSDYSVVVNNL